MKQFLNNLTGWGISSLLLLCITTGSTASDHKFKIEEAKWEQEKSRLKVKGKGERGKTVNLFSAAAQDVRIGTAIVDRDEWKINITNPREIPCRVRVQQSDGRVAEKAVKKAPPNCDGSPGGNPPPVEEDPPVTIYPDPTTGEEAHAHITAYEGPGTCVTCHEEQAEDMHGSVHYQQTGPTDFVTNIEGPGGERGNGAIGINTYCGTHENSPRFTCAGCHVGNGRFPKPELPMDEPARTEELSNIDCLMCHQEVYKRFPAGDFEPLTQVMAGLDGLPDPENIRVLTGLSGVPAVDPDTQDFVYEPAGTDSRMPIMPITGLEAAQTVHKTTRRSCLNCHAGAGGGDGTKRGDMSTVLVEPPLHIDMHMSSAGEGMTCSDCHNAGGHRVFGRGLDLRPNDVPERFSCESCHDRPHKDFSNTKGKSRDQHATRVACQSCHIPTYAKGVPTEVSRDWEKPHFSSAACNGRGGWLPEEIKAGDLIPTYAWFDGTSEVYYLGEPLDAVPTKRLRDGSQAYVLGKPNGNVNDEGAKIYPMKEHISKSARHLASNELIGHSTFEFFRTGSFAKAVESGLAQEGRPEEAYDVVPVHTYQTINHGVEVEDNALKCGDCHSDREFDGGPARMNLQADLGYELKASSSVVCTQCHEFKESKGFKKNHEKHVDDKGYDCMLCHNFTRPERGLRTAIK